MNLESKAYDAGIMPILFAEEEGCVKRVIHAIEQTALPAVEILQRGSAAPNALKEAAKIKTTALVGAGTVCTLEHCKRVVDMGADFIVSPACDIEMVDWCMANDVPIVPGVSTVTELMEMSNRGVKLVKYFPFFELGGEAFLNAFSGPFPDMKFVITGSVDDRALTYLHNPKIAAIGGVWMFQSEEDHTVISEQDIIARANYSLELAKHFRHGW